MSDSIINSMGLSGVPRPKFGFSRPIVNVVPLTFRNASSMLEEVEEIKSYLIRLYNNIGENDDKILDAFEKAVNDFTTALVENAVELQDSVVSEIAVDTTTMFYAILENKLASVIREDPDDAGTFIVRPPVTPPNSGVKPDPADPGFFQ